MSQDDDKYNACKDMTMKKFVTFLLIFIAVVTLAVFFYSFSYNLALGQSDDPLTLEAQMQSNTTAFNATREAAIGQAVEGLLKSEEQQKQQEKILNITQLWVDAGLVNFEAGEYSSTFLPADIVYQGNNTIVLEAESFGGGTRFWHAVEIVQGQGFEIKDTMVLNDEMITYDGEEFTIYNTVRVLLVK